ncbi:hypothetical protein FHX74_000488 [Friedmanniella endophytica]|uniref:Uncharacterized protein n=1 Tax=Microlunatus kandeliicorticis TaxID=1759536 RepID=A0A7W3IPK4_9ACTN|nr:hypothetical protein [Microlunatus kandeliicorticis]MBA8792894.1 hypothetical protein [Microlunatus kandeliicorticis]
MRTVLLRLLRLTLLGVVVALALALVAMHQLRPDAGRTEPPSALSVTSSGQHTEYTQHTVPSTQVDTRASAPAMDCALAAGCLLLLVLTVLRPAHRLGSVRALASRRIRGPGQSRTGPLPRLRARSPSRLEFGVCRT